MTTFAITCSCPTQYEPHDINGQRVHVFLHVARCSQFKNPAMRRREAEVRVRGIVAAHPIGVR